MIKTVNTTTNNVAKELLRIAKVNSVPVSKLYIDVIAIDTYVKEAGSDFVKIFHEDFKKY